MQTVFGAMSTAHVHHCLLQCRSFLFPLVARDMCVCWALLALSVAADSMAASTLFSRHFGMSVVVQWQCMFDSSAEFAPIILTHHAVVRYLSSMTSAS
jgi:hypothetical protein